MIDVLVLGTDQSGKTSLIRAISGEEKVQMSSSTSKVNDITKIALDSYQISCREMSHSYVKSWESYVTDAKVIVVVY